MGEQVAGLAERYRERRWYIDPLAVALLSGALAALGFRGVWRPLTFMPLEISPWWSLAFALPACAALLGKRRAPMTVLIAVSGLFVVDLLIVGGIGTLLALLDALWTAVFLATPRQRTALKTALLLATAVSFVGGLLRADGELSIALIIALQFGAMFGTDYWWAVAVSQAHELAELHRQRADDLAEQAERDRAEAVHEERVAMARELHDAVAGHVMAMAIRAEAALATPPDERADRAALQAVRDAGLEAHGALRTMISVLRSGDGELAPPPRREDLDGVIEDARRAGLEVTADLTAQPLPAVVEQAVVRIVREALSNAVRHAAGARVEVEIAADADAAEVQVRSRGGSASAHAAGSGWGLSMLEERVRALDGDFRAGPESDGWLVSARVPIGGRA